MSSHFPKYVRTGYFKKGVSWAREFKKQCVTDFEWMMGFGLMSVGVFVLVPVTAYRLSKEGPNKFQFKTEYTVIRDTEVDLSRLTTYNSDELEQAKKYNKNIP